MAFSRPLDQLYKVYFLLRIPITLFVDLKSLFPRKLSPEFSRSINEFYVASSGDPFLKGTLGNKTQLAWFQAFTYLEAFFQTPAFFICLYGLYKGYRAVYIMILIYGASTFTTVLPCLVTIWTIPASNGFMIPGVPSMTEAQKWMTIYAYLPFAVIPLIMVLDGGLQLLGAVQGPEVVVKKSGRSAKLK